MLTLNDGRSELWQWDTGRTLAVDADCSQVHFSNKVFGRSIDVNVIDGAAIIPDVLLQTDKDLNVWAFVGTAENGYTKISKTFRVNRRNKPADYVFTPTEQTTIAEIAAIAQSVRDDADAGMFGGAQPDWNQNDSNAADYVKNRPFYTGDPVENVIIPETTVTFSKMSGFMAAVWPESFDLVDGQTYTISWDGTDYVCTGILFGGSTPVLGNLGAAGLGDDSGEPFAFVNQGQWLVVSTESATEHIISISESVAEVVKIPEKYVNQHTHILERDFWAKSSESGLIDIVNQFNAGDVFVYQNDASSCVLLLYASYIKTQGFKFVYMDDFAIRMISGDGGNWTTKYSEIAFS